MVTHNPDDETVALPTVPGPGAAEEAVVMFADANADQTEVHQIDLRQYGEVYSTDWQSADWRNGVLRGLGKAYFSVKRHFKETSEPVFSRPFAHNPLEVHMKLKPGVEEPYEVSVVYAAGSPEALGTTVERWLYAIGAASVQRYTNEALGAEMLKAIFYHFDT